MKFKDLLKILPWDTKVYVLPLHERFEPIRSVLVNSIRYCDSPSTENPVNCDHINNKKVTSVSISAMDELTIFI